MPYNMDLAKISILEYKETLKRQTLLPGRRILHDNIDTNFERMAQYGVRTVAELKKNLSTPKKLSVFSKGTDIENDYLTILKRELGSMEQKPVPLADFPGVDENLIAKLNDSGIKTSKDYYEQAGIKDDELSALCDLVRINGVGAVAARMFIEGGYGSVEAVASANAVAMLASITAINEEKQYYKAKLGEKDMQFCIDFAKLLIRYGG